MTCLVSEVYRYSYHGTSPAFSLSLAQFPVVNNASRTSTGVHVHYARNLSQYRVIYRLDRLKMYIHTAILDDRFQNTVIHILGMQPKADNHSDHFYCLFDCHDQNNPDVTWRVRGQWQLIDPNWPHWSPYMGFIVNCSVPDVSGLDTSHVTLQSLSGDNSVRIAVESPYFNPGEPRLLAACVKPVTGEFYVSRLAEWVEMNRLVGVERILFYNTDIIGASRFVLRYYNFLGVVQTVDFPYLTSVLSIIESQLSVTGQQRYALYQHAYLVAYQDCLYRFQRQYSYLAIIDVDEVIVPFDDVSLHSVIQKSMARYPLAASLSFYTAWHFEEYGALENSASSGSRIPDYLHMQKFATAGDPDEPSPKSILVTARCLLTNFHGVTSVVHRNLSAYSVPWWDTGYVHHYRRDTCVSYMADEFCKKWKAEAKTDPRITRYYDRMQSRMSRVMDQLQLVT